MTTRRVFNLANELGVTSKAILDKCRAEGLDLKNHMATLSAGLEATIREWFTEGATQTAVETAEAVDLTKVRRRPRKKKKAEGVEEPSDAAGEAVAVAETEQPEIEVGEPGIAEHAGPSDDSAVAVAEPPEPEAPSEPAAPSEPDEDLPPDVPVLPELAEEPALPQEPAGEPELPSVAATAEPTVDGPAAPTPVVEEPTVEKPPVAGPQNVPAPAQMKGPRVVRVERPEPVSRPRPRTAAGPAGGAGGAAPTVGGPPRPTRRRPGMGIGEPAPEAEGEAAKGGKGAKRRVRSPRRSGRSEVTERIREWRDQDLLERQERLAQATGRLRTRRSDEGHHGAGQGKPAAVIVEVPISVKDLSSLIGVKASDIIRKLMELGTMATMNHVLDGETVSMVADEFGVEIEVKAEKTPDEKLAEEFAQMSRDHLEHRPPVVTILGHVDHGKTSLLDRIRSTNVVSGESGGITQHIGAYRWEKDGKVVVFLDTPGHAAFTEMRSRGANMTDVVVLVVAADDGVMPQTIESINHARAAGVPIVVALNKIDRPDADEHRVFGQLAEHGLSPREWGGSTEVVKTSATTGQGVDSLLELLSLEAELLELKADPTLPATGTVIEANMDSGRGPVARVLVQDGSLKIGDVVVCGPACGRVKALLSDRGRDMRKAGPATPVEVVGLDAVPEPGEKLYAVNDLDRAKEISEARVLRQREAVLAKRQAVTLENLFTRISAGETRELPLIVKADVQGSVDVLVEQINKLSTSEVRVHILHAAVGGVTESDVLLAAASNAIVIGFHVVPDEAARALASERGVQIRLYKVIYEITDAIHKALEGMLAPEIQEKVLGHADVRQTFKVSRIGTIAGCHVSDGVLQRSAKYRLVRDGVIVQDNLSLDSLKRFKDDAREVRAGLECGIKLAGYDDIKVGDRLEAWTTQEVARTL